MENPKLSYQDGNASFNFVKRDVEILDKSIDRFWQTESYGVSKSDDPNLIPQSRQKSHKYFKLEFNQTKQPSHCRISLEGR